MTALADAARMAWIIWGHWDAKYTICSCCNEDRYCRRTKQSRWICLDCFDQR